MHANAAPPGVIPCSAPAGEIASSSVDYVVNMFYVKQKRVTGEFSPGLKKE